MHRSSNKFIDVFAGCKIHSEIGFETLVFQGSLWTGEIDEDGKKIEVAAISKVV